MDVDYVKGYSHFILNSGWDGEKAPPPVTSSAQNLKVAKREKEVSPCLAIEIESPLRAT